MVGVVCAQFALLHKIWVSVAYPIEVGYGDYYHVQGINIFNAKKPSDNINFTNLKQICTKVLFKRF